MIRNELLACSQRLLSRKIKSELLKGGYSMGRVEYIEKRIGIHTIHTYNVRRERKRLRMYISARFYFPDHVFTRKTKSWEFSEPSSCHYATSRCNSG